VQERAHKMHQAGCSSPALFLIPTQQHQHSITPHTSQTCCRHQHNTQCRAGHGQPAAGAAQHTIRHDCCRSGAGQQHRCQRSAASSSCPLASCGCHSAGTRQLQASLEADKEAAALQQALADDPLLSLSLS
jgi:hypothetical protein